jgi:hypothetical protein
MDAMTVSKRKSSRARGILNLGLSYYCQNLSALFKLSFATPEGSNIATRLCFLCILSFQMT